MITMAWYNIVAIVVGMLTVFLLWRNERNARRSTGYAEGLIEMFNKIFTILMLAALFYAIWGGIFWW